MSGKTQTGLERAAALSERLLSEDSRRLFSAFCGELVSLPGDVRVETTPFEVRFACGERFRVSLSPYRELFLVSVGDRSPCTVRISSEADFYTALDLAVQHFLETA